MEIQIGVGEKFITIQAPYNADFINAARCLAGKWQQDSKTWHFDIRDEKAVREICKKYYGSDGHIVDPKVDVRVTILEDIQYRREGINLFNRTVARAYGKQSGAVLGEGIILEKGGFSSGGSNQYWETTACKGTVFLMRDISSALVERYENDAFLIEILTEHDIDNSALAAERKRLLERIAKIDELLARSGL